MGSELASNIERGNTRTPNLVSIYDRRGTARICRERLRDPSADPAMVRRRSSMSL